MTGDQLRADLLRALYEAWCEVGDMDLGEWECGQGLQSHASRPHLRRLSEEGLAAGAGSGPRIELTARGVLYVEQQGLAPQDLVLRNQGVRHSILEELLRVREEEGEVEAPNWEGLRSRAGAEFNELRRNLDVLRGLGLVHRKELEITAAGVERARNRREENALTEEFAKLKELEDVTPQQRGREFEKLLERFVSIEGWEAERDVRSPGEQQDLVIHQGREYYLVECKWEGDPVEPRAIREFRDRVTARPGLRGLFFSMSGYTDAPKEDARDRLESCMILLFGPGDIERLFSFQCSFTESLNAKFDAAMARRQILVE